ncbi:hypothetical protein MMAGJ_55230 [Mycolicibacterium mageritense]|uniref:Uncharacterized protein n=1 Tax=Mycolicibacterium mageritense TaxID=53462 RepID=A0ABM7I039_MYCME|nr:hypothetical protein MMAGJ_55230 [Mycolicibacterium mageritense]
MTDSAPVIAKLDEIVRTTVTHAIARAIPSTDNTNRSGRRRMFANANRIRQPKVLPVVASISGARRLVANEAVDSTAQMLRAPCFTGSSPRCRAG